MVMLVTSGILLYLHSQDGSNSALSSVHVVKVDMLSVSMQYNILSRHLLFPVIFFSLYVLSNNQLNFSNPQMKVDTWDLSLWCRSCSDLFQ